MEHRGVEYRIIQGIQRGIWKWSVETEPGTKSGISDSKDAAMAAAKRAIDNALDPKKRSLHRQRETPFLGFSSVPVSPGPGLVPPINSTRF